MKVWVISYVGSSLELSHMEKGKIVLPWDGLFHPREELTADNFTVAAKVYGRYFYWAVKVPGVHVHVKYVLLRANC